MIDSTKLNAELIALIAEYRIRLSVRHERVLNLECLRLKRQIKAQVWMIRKLGWPVPRYKWVRTPPGKPGPWRYAPESILMPVSAGGQRWKKEKPPKKVKKADEMPLFKRRRRKR